MWIQKVEEAVKEYGSSPSRTSPAPSTPAARTPSPSSASTTSVTARVESTKRLMINKALGETMLHRAARLGYLVSEGGWCGPADCPVFPG